MKSFLDSAGASGLRLLSGFLSCLSNDAAAGLARFIGSAVFFFHSRKRVAYADLKAAFGGRFTEKERWRIVRKHYEHIAHSAVEILRLPKLSEMPPRELFEVHTQGPFFEELKENKAAIFLTAHFGNWEMLQLFAKSENRSVSVLARDQKFPKTNQVLNDIRERAGFHVNRTGMGVRDFLHSLRRHELVGLLGDQDAGKQGGLILRFFGRKTTVPPGAFEIAGRAGVRLYPIFMARRGEKTFYDIHVDKAALLDPDKPEQAQAAAENYLKRLEEFISKNPEQWLWGAKRWKYSWTKRILILSDGKPGHVKQSEGIAAQFLKITSQYDRPGMEYPVSTLEVRFRSRFHRVLFSYFSVLFLPWAQGRLSVLKFFLEEGCAEKIIPASADFIISAGSSLAPLNLYLARDCRAKSIVAMKPGFPFNFYKYDMAVVPAHDEGPVPEGTLRTLIAPARMESGEMEAAAKTISKNMKQPEKVRVSVFVGGPTRRYQIRLEDIKELCGILNKRASSWGHYALTTSRRTPAEIENFLKQNQNSACELTVIAREDSRREVVPGMMAMADILIVTEESVSMISEGLRSGKKVVVLSFETGNLPAKHKRFQDLLAKESAVTVANLKNLEEKIEKLKAAPGGDFVGGQDQILKKRLQEIL